jgi:hypothetical protein
MDKINTAVIARLSRRRTASLPLAYDRAIQYSRDIRVQPRSRGVLDRPVKPGDDSLVVAGRRGEIA